MLVSFDPSLDGDAAFVPGFEGGLIFQHLNEPHLGIQLELMYSQASWQQDFDTLNYFRQTLYNVELPFLSYFYLGKPNKSLYFVLGSTPGYTFRREDENRIVDTVAYDQLNNRRYSQLILGLTGGIGIMQKIGPGYVQLEARASQRFINLFTGQASGSSRPLVISGSLAYLFELGKRTRKK